MRGKEIRDVRSCAYSVMRGAAFEMTAGIMLILGGIGLINAGFHLTPDYVAPLNCVVLTYFVCIAELLVTGAMFLISGIYDWGFGNALRDADREEDCDEDDDGDEGE